MYIIRAKGVRTAANKLCAAIGRGNHADGAPGAAGSALVRVDAAAHALLDGDQLLARNRACAHTRIGRSARSATAWSHGCEARESLQMCPERLARVRFVGSMRAHGSPASRLQVLARVACAPMRKSPVSTRRALSEGRGTGRPIARWVKAFVALVARVGARAGVIREPVE